MATRLPGHPRLKLFTLLTQELRPTREGVQDSCLVDGQTNLLFRHNPRVPYGVKGVLLTPLIFGK